MVCSGSLSTLAAAIGSQPSQALTQSDFTGVCTDSRQVQPGNLFVALVGETFDGHKFVETALDRGAVAAIASRPVHGPHLLVDDTLAAYQSIARWWRLQFDIPVIAITGSAGKTSTKELLAAALSSYGKVLKSAANYNNDIGVPQTLLQLDRTHDYAVVEMAMRGPGEIARLAQTARPTHGIVINVGTAHIGRLGSREAIARAKCELLQQLDPDSGLAILNAEDELLMATAAQVWSGQTSTFGLTGGDITASWQAWPPQLAIDTLTLPVPLPGRHQALNYLAALTAIASLDLDITRLSPGISLPATMGGRNRQLTLPDGVHILDETYNAAPEATLAALQLLHDSPAQQRWAILGPMRELGAAAAELYASVGRKAAELKIDRICLLDEAGELADLAAPIPADRLHTFDSRDRLAQWLHNCVQPDDCLLFKAARSIELETVLEAFLQLHYPNEANIATS